MAVLKPFTVMLCSSNGRYYRMRDRVLNRLEMALYGILIVVYVVGILYYTVIDDSWGIGVNIFR